MHVDPVPNADINVFSESKLSPHLPNPPFISPHLPLIPLYPFLALCSGHASNRTTIDGSILLLLPVLLINLH